MCAGKSVNYKDDYYQNQIKEYTKTLKNENTAKNNNTTQNTSTDTKQLLLNVMNNKQKFIDEDNNEVYFKDFKIVENQTAKVDKYAFVDMDKDYIRTVDTSIGKCYSRISDEELYEKYHNKLPIFFVEDIYKEIWVETLFLCLCWCCDVYLIGTFPVSPQGLSVIPAFYLARL